MNPIEELKGDLSPGIKEYVDRIDGYKRMMSDLCGMPNETPKSMRLFEELEKMQRDEFGLKVFRWRIIAGSKAGATGRGWIRLFSESGPGIKWRDVTRTEATFSERNGHERRLVIGKWSIGYLSRS
jgi:hypothetical protein